VHSFSHSDTLHHLTGEHDELQATDKEGGNTAANSAICCKSNSIIQRLYNGKNDSKDSVALGGGAAALYTKNFYEWWRARKTSGFPG
jgi:hypothetical protein